MRNVALAALGLLVSLATGCASTMKPVFVNQLNVPFNAPMVATKSSTPFYIVAEPSDIPNDMKTSEGVVKPVEIHEVRTFVTRDVKRMFEAFYSNVTVVESEAKLPAEPGVIAKIRVTAIDTKADMAMGSGGAFAGRVFGVIDWSVGVRPTSAKDFAYTYTAKVVGTFSLTNVDQADQMIRNTFEEALMSFTKDWVEKGIPAKLEGASKS